MIYNQQWRYKGISNVIVCSWTLNIRSDRLWSSSENCHYS